MCYSANASFAAGALLIPAGFYCLTAAWRKRPSSLPMAAAPLLFGIQQISEGYVWHGLEHGDVAHVRLGSLVFLFFALALWPFWFSFISAIMDPRPLARKIFTGMAIACTAWFWILYYPIITGSNSLLTTRIVHHSVQYDFSGLAIYNYIPLTPLRVIYFMSVALPMSFGTGSLGRVPSIVFGASAVVAAVAFNYAFVSVWCFAAALLSGYLCWFFRAMKS